MTATDLARDLALVAAQAAADKQGSDIAVIDVSDRLALTDCFVVATGSNERQVGAIVDEVTERLSRQGIKPLRREGERDGRWVLLDFNEVVVHIQHAEERVFYALDRLWGDCPTIPFTDAAAGDSGSDGVDDRAGEIGDDSAGDDGARENGADENGTIGGAHVARQAR